MRTRRRQAHDETFGAVGGLLFFAGWLLVIFRFVLQGLGAMSPINAEVVMVQQMREATRVLDIILAVLVGAVIAVAALTGAAVYLGVVAMRWLQQLWRRWFTAPETLFEHRARVWCSSAEYAKRYGKAATR